MPRNKESREEMNSGCICCALVGDFGKNLNEVITKYHPDRILIEPSGVGKLSDVMKSVIDIENEQDVKLNALVTVVNALKASKQMKAFGEFFNNQIEYATTVILSRSQNATPEQLEFCVKQIQKLNPNAAIITTDWNAIGGEQILKVMEGQDNPNLQSIHIGVYAEFVLIHGTLKTCNILIVLALGTCKSRVLSNTLYCLLSIYLCFNGCDGRPFCFISMTACKFDDISQIKSRVTNGVRVKWYIIYYSNCRQDIVYDPLSLFFQAKL